MDLQWGPLRALSISLHNLGQLALREPVSHPGVALEPWLQGSSAHSVSRTVPIEDSRDLHIMTIS